MKSTNKSLAGASFIGLKDIARHCNLSAMTVSRALRNVKGVSPKTREKILKTANELGYVPNLVASNLITRKTNTIGVVVPDIGVTIFPAVVKGIESVLNKENYRIFLCCTFDNPGKEYQEVQTLLKHRVDGIILAPTSTTESREIVWKIIASGRHLVLIDRIIPGMDISSVVITDYEAAYQLVAHMLEQGYRKIVHLSGPRNVWTASERLRGYQQALKDAGLKPHKQDVIHSGFTVESGIAETERLLDSGKRPDAIFCVNDPVALGAYQVLRKRGIDIPRSMGLAGFSNLLESELLAVPLTSVTHDTITIGQQSARILLSQISASGETEFKPVHQKLHSQLVIRESTLLRA